MAPKEKFIKNGESVELFSLVKTCLQCGLCSSVCPSTRFLQKDFNVRLLSLKMLRKENLASSKDGLEVAWKCFLCFDCSKLCPHSIPLPEIVIKLRINLLAEGFANDVYKLVEEVAKNLLNTGSILPFGRINIRRFLGLNPSPEISKESLEKIRNMLRQLGFEEFLSKLSLNYKSGIK
ncbi:MAG: 4Fe-4S dicluster domain-containing protein [Candidatus Bathyarchaeota archaeon]